MPIQLNTSYLNRTPNKTPRNTRTFKPEFVVMHETAGYGSLEWNLRADVRSSYNYLINRNGVIYHYVDEKAYIAWHAGISSAARGYTGGQINIYGIGVELEGPNEGTPITTAQTKAMIELIKHFREVYGIPITRQYYFGHKDVAPGYKSDPMGYSVEHTIKMISDEEAAAAPLPNKLGAVLRNEVYKLAGGNYHPEWAFHQFAKANNLGSPIKVGMDFTTRGQRYTGEVYGRDIVVSPYNQWNIILRANQITDNDLYNDLMRFAYGALGVDFRPEQAFYHFVRNQPIGVPLGDSMRFQTRTGATVAAQIWSLDTLYTPVAPAGQSTDWSVVRQLSAIVAARTVAEADAALRDVIFEAMYARVSDRYLAEGPFIKKAFALGLGAPLSAQREVAWGGNTYEYVVYAGDTLFRKKGESTIRQLSKTAD